MVISIDGQSGKGTREESATVQLVSLLDTVHVLRQSESTFLLTVCNSIHYSDIVLVSAFPARKSI